MREKSFLSVAIVSISITLAVFQLGTAAIAPLQGIEQRSLHLFFILPLGFLYEAQKCKGKKLRQVFFCLLALGSAAASFYTYTNWLDIQNRTTMLVSADYVFSFVLIFAILVLTYRSIGLGMPLITLCFILYAYVGPYLRGVFYFSPISLRRFVSCLYCGTEGIFGTCLAASATYVFMFIMFGEFLSKYGAGDFFIRLSESLFGRMRGASGKIAIITSALFGMISGSPTANVAATGCLTIPLMEKSGYNGEYSSAVVAAAASGGSICPPVMGTGAFIMAEMIGMSYGSICMAAMLPALLYFMSLFIMVDLNAVRNALVIKNEPKRISLREAFTEGWHYLLTIVVLFVSLIVLDRSPAKSSALAIGTLLACDIVNSLIKRERVDISKFYNALISSCKSAITIGAVTACAGIIIGCFNATGLNLRLSSMLIELSGGNSYVLLILTAVGALILGLGLPATPVYVLMAVMVAPALVKMGIPKLAAHMFVFYFGAMAPLTPPVGTCFFVAAGLSKSNPMRVGMRAWCMAMVAFLLPFIWVYEPAFLLEGALPEIFWAVFTGVVATCTLAFGIEGYMLADIGIAKRFLLVAAAILIVVPELISSIVGFGIILLLTTLQLLRKIGPKRT